MEIREHEQLQKWTTFRAGGTARYFTIVESKEDLIEALEYANSHRLPYVILGGGSNTLFQDREFPGLVIRMQLLGFKIDEQHQTVYAEAGVPFSRVVKETVRRGLRGFEWGTGLPGSVGGAIRGNAGCFGGETKDGLVQVEVLQNQDGRVEEHSLAAKELQMTYRDSIFKHNPNLIIVSALWKLQKGQQEVLKEVYDANMQAKLASQPTGTLCAGSFFKGIHIDNLSDESRAKVQPFLEFQKGNILPASLMIDRGLHMKGVQHGGAQISPKHAGFIVNTGSATTDDILKLAESVEQKMKSEYGIDLEKEIEVI